MKMKKLLISLLATLTMCSPMTVFAANSDSADQNQSSNQAQSSSAVIDSINGQFGQSVMSDISNTKGQMQSGQSALGNFNTESFVKSFGDFESFKTQTAFTMPNLDSVKNTEQLNLSYTVMSLKLQNSGFGQTTQLDTSNRLNYSQNAMSVFQNNFGGLSYDSIDIGTAQNNNYLESAKNNNFMQNALTDRSNALGTFRNTPEYATVKNNTSLSGMYANVLSVANGDPESRMSTTGASGQSTKGREYSLIQNMDARWANTEAFREAQVSVNNDLRRQNAATVDKSMEGLYSSRCEEIITSAVNSYGIPSDPNFTQDTLYNRALAFVDIINNPESYNQNNTSDDVGGTDGGTDDGTIDGADDDPTATPDGETARPEE